MDLDGKAVGINIARAGRTESYAIPSETVQALLTDLKSGKLAPKDEMEDKQVTLLCEMIRELRGPTSPRPSRERDELSDDAPIEVKKSAEEGIADLKKKLTGRWKNWRSFGRTSRRSAAGRG